MSMLDQQLRELIEKYKRPYRATTEYGKGIAYQKAVAIQQLEEIIRAAETSASAVSDEDVDAALNAAFYVEDSDDSYGFRSLLKRSIRAALEADRKRRAAQQVIGEPVAWMHPKSFARLMKAKGNGDEDANGYAYAYAFPGSKEDVALFTAHLATRAAPPAAQAVPMLLYCPVCGSQHIDSPDAGIAPGQTTGWDNPPHRSHLCHSCGCIWRPADVATVGVSTTATKGKADTFDASRGRELPRDDAQAVPDMHASEAYPTGNDREVLNYLMLQFDCESWECDRCGHSEDTATMDSAIYLPEYLRSNPQPSVAPMSIPAGWALVPSSFHIPAGAFEALAGTVGGDTESDDPSEHWQDGVAWIGEMTNDDGSKTHGLHVYCGNYHEDGSITLAEFAATPTGDVLATKEPRA